MADLTQNEKRLLAVLEKEKKAEAPRLASMLGATPEAVVQWAHLAQEKGLVTTERIVGREYLYTDEGRGYLEHGLPETQLLHFIGQGTTLTISGSTKHLKSGLASCGRKGSSGLKALPLRRHQELPRKQMKMP